MCTTMLNTRKRKKRQKKDVGDFRRSKLDTSFCARVLFRDGTVQNARSPAEFRPLGEHLVRASSHSVLVVGSLR